MACSNECVAKCVLLVIEFNYSPIFEFDLLKTCDLEINWVYICFNWKTRVTWELIQIIRTINQNKTDRWVVTYLLNEHMAAIRKSCLMCFAKDWVKRLSPSMVRHQASYCCSHHELHPLNWVLWKCGSWQVRSHWRCDASDCLQDWLGCHAGDRKWHLS